MLRAVFLIEYAFALVERDWLACSVPNQWCISVKHRSCWFGMNFIEPDCQTSRCKIKYIIYILCLWRARRNVDCLLIAKLVAISAVENPPWFGEQQELLLLVAGSSLRRPWSLFVKDKRQWFWIMWDRGTRRFQSVGPRDLVAHVNGAWPGLKCVQIRETNSHWERMAFWPVRVFQCKALAVSKVKESSYLVDPASSHMLVSKIKPCMSKYKQVCTVKLRMAH